MWTRMVWVNLTRVEVKIFEWESLLLLLLIYQSFLCTEIMKLSFLSLLLSLFFQSVFNYSEHGQMWSGVQKNISTVIKRLNQNPSLADLSAAQMESHTKVIWQFHSLTLKTERVPAWSLIQILFLICFVQKVPEI